MGKHSEFDDKAFLRPGSSNKGEASDFKEIKFELDPTFKGRKTEEEKINDNILEESMMQYFEMYDPDSYEKVFLDPKNGSINIAYFNSFYQYVRNKMMADYTPVEIFSNFLEILGINYVKGYNALGVKFKEEIIVALDLDTRILTKLNINRLF